MHEFIGDLCSFYLALVGILVSVLTLILTSLVSKVEAKNAILNSKDINIVNQRIRYENEIKIFRSLNKKLLRLLLASALLCLMSYVVKELPNSVEITWPVIILGVLTLIFLFCLIKPAFLIYRKYLSDNNLK